MATSMYRLFTYYIPTIIFTAFLIILVWILSDPEFGNYWNELLNEYVTESHWFQFTVFAGYGMASAVPLSPLPAEGSLLFIGRTNWVILFIAPALGKAICFTVLAFLVRSSTGKKTALLDRIKDWANKSSKQLFDKLSKILKMQSRPFTQWIVYLTCQSIPFLPMRTTVIIITTMTLDQRDVPTIIFFLTFLGGVIRIWLLFTAINLGVEVLI